MGIAERLFARAVRLLPDDFAAEYGPDMIATFAARSAEQQSRVKRLLFTVRELSGVVMTVITERIAAAPGRAAVLPKREESHVVDHLLIETRHAARRLLRTPGFTMAAVLTLALAIGANTAIFTLLHRVVLSPLPYPSSDRLISIEHAAPGVGLLSGLGISPGIYQEYGRLPTTAAISMHTTSDATLSGDGAAEQLETVLVTPSLGAVLEIQPLLGRWFTEAEGSPDSDRVVVLTHAAWQSRFGGSADVLGTMLRLDGELHEVIGIMPPGFAFPDTDTKLIMPLRMRDEGRFGGFNYQGVARLEPGVTMEQARQAHEDVIAGLPGRYPADAALMQSLVGEVRLGSLAAPLRDRVLGSTARMLWVLLGSVMIVLLIACANVANLFLVRADARQREVAVRRALGAGRGNVGAYFLSETMLVALVSGALGLLLGYAAVRVLVMNGPVGLPRLHEVRIDGTVVAFTAFASLISALFFGLMPLVRRLPPLAAVLQDASRGNTGGGARMRARHALMAAQVAFAVVLLVAAGLMVQSVRHMWSVDAGFDAESRLVFRIGLPRSEYPTDEAAAAFHDRMLERLRALPGVRQAAVSTRLPLDGDGEGDPLDVQGRPLGFDDLGPVVRYRRVSADFFTALNMSLRHGRYLDARDADGRTAAAVVNQALVDVYFPNEDPIGKHVRKMAGDEDGDWLTIVGVVDNTPTYNLQEDSPSPKLYLAPRSVVESRVSSMHAVSYVLHADVSPTALIAPVRSALSEMNPNVALARPEPLRDLLDRAGARLAFTMMLLVLAAAGALLLGMIGVYAVISYAIAQRTSEIGLRLALGAQPGDVIAMIVRQSGRVVAAGVVIGIAAAAGGARVLQALLFGVAWNDVSTYAAAGIGLFAVALFASWLPARRVATHATSLHTLFR
jgi:putative ABC transport system permease protein